jgi:15-cis-phytoene synthase
VPNTGIAQKELDESYRRCREISRSRARNFYYSFMVLPREKRDAMCAVYAFMRFCDDIADDEEFEHNRLAMLDAWRESLDKAMQGDYSGSPILPAFHDTITKFHIPPTLFHELIDGAAMDLSAHTYESFDQLYDYCYKVASVVGLVCIRIFGFDSPEATKHAEFCGIAFQLTNILRDLKEDASMGRVYIPDEDLWAFGYGKDELAEGISDERFHRLMKFEVLRAKCYYSAALPLLDLVHPSGKPGLAAMISIYYGILDRIERSDYDVFSGEMSLSKTRKLGIAAKALMLSRLNGGRPYLRGLQ